MRLAINCSKVEILQAERSSKMSQSPSSAPVPGSTEEIKDWVPYKAETLIPKGLVKNVPIIKMKSKRKQKHVTRN